MRKLHSSSVRGVFAGAISLIALSANAADIYHAPEGGYKDDPVYAPLWTGFYAGVNAGYAWGNSSTVTETGVGTAKPFGTAIDTFFPFGDAFGGGQIGYNWQRGPIVYGLEADIEGAGIRGSGIATLDATHFAQGSTHLNWFGTVRGRLGVTIFERGLLYATGGFAYGGEGDALLKKDPGLGFESSNKVGTGYVVGGGVEYQLAPKWSLKGEYQYFDLGKTSYSLDAAAATVYTAQFDARHAFNTIRVGVNYHFLPAYEPLK
jgi:outer membrane immunogenic protein